MSAPNSAVVAAGASKKRKTANVDDAEKEKERKDKKNSYHKDMRGEQEEIKQRIFKRVKADNEKAKAGGNDDSKAVKQLRKVEAHLDELDATIIEKDRQIQEKDELIETMNDGLADAWKRNEALEAENEALRAKLAELEAQKE